MEDLVVGDLIVAGSDLEERFETSGGPGGQHANRSATAVVLRLDLAGSSLPDEVKHHLVSRLGSVVETRASESRSQARNREVARQRMARKVAGALVTRKRRRRTRPTRAAKERRLASKRARSEIKKSRRTPLDEP